MPPALKMRTEATPPSLIKRHKHQTSTSHTDTHSATLLHRSHASFTQEPLFRMFDTQNLRYPNKQQPETLDHSAPSVLHQLRLMEVCFSPTLSVYPIKKEEEFFRPPEF